MEHALTGLGYRPASLLYCQTCRDFIELIHPFAADASV